MLPIVFINLDSDAERRGRMLDEFKQLGLVGERIKGTRWTELPVEQQTRLYSAALNQKQFHKPLVNGEKGCYASHLACWQWLLDSDHDAVVILEDDVRLAPQFAAVIEAIAALPSNWDMIKLIGRPEDISGKKLSHAQDLLPGISLVDYKRIPSLAAGYVLSRRGAEKLLASRIPFGRPIDVDLRHWWENEVRVRGVVPPVIRLDDTSLQSSIGAKVPENSIEAKWRKFSYKLGYTLLNAWHR